MVMIPPGLAESCRGVPAREAWLHELPASIAESVRRWTLDVGAPFVASAGSCAWVAAVTMADGNEAVLKIALPHPEGVDEIAGLRFWGGEGTVRLLDADEARGTLLLERCRPGTSLGELPESEQDAVLGAVLPRLWRRPPAGSRFRPLAAMLAHWAEETRATMDVASDVGLVEAGLDLFRELSVGGGDDVLLFTDLHAGNVLRAARAPWLAIDPKPFVGDRAYDATQHLFNCPGRMRAAPFETIASFADRLGVSRERVRLWMFARAAAQPRARWAGDPWLEVARRLAP